MKLSEHVCARCGVAAHWCRHGGWKHATGRRAGTSCGRAPKVVDRSTYERTIEALLSA